MPVDDLNRPDPMLPQREAGFSTGQRVRVVAGEFSGFGGTFLRPFSDSRCQVAVDIGPGLRVMHTLYFREIERLTPGGQPNE